MRPQIRDIVDFIIKNNPSVKACYKQFGKDLVKRDDNVKAMCVRQKIIDPLPYLVEDKYLEDMYRRLGDKVIQAAFAIKKKEERGRKKCKRYSTRKRVEQRHRKFLFDRSLKIAEQVEDEVIRAFEEYQRKLSEAEYDRLIEEWLGHAKFSTTADIYSHLDYSSKLESADVFTKAFGQKKEASLSDTDVLYAKIQEDMFRLGISDFEDYVKHLSAQSKLDDGSQIKKAVSDFEM